MQSFGVMLIQKAIQSSGAPFCVALQVYGLSWPFLPLDSWPAGSLIDLLVAIGLEQLEVRNVLS